MTQNRRLTITKNVLWMITGSGFVVGMARLIYGLGATTALTDNTSWGIWIGFDVMGGVALAAGGFVIAGMVYIFHLKAFQPLLRSTVLTAFLGYLAVVIGLTIDIGRPWMIWSPAIHWQIHSALFEVAWCVMLYTTVLALEFAPVVFDKFPRANRLFHPLRRITIPLVILGIMLSSMHQSTLGTLLVIMPFRVDPLWYTPWLPLLFFVSAVGLGLAMVISESMVSGWLFHRELEQPLLYRIARGLQYVLVLYLILILANLASYGNLSLLFSGSWESILYWVEIMLSAIAPAVLLSFPRVSSSAVGLGASAGMVVLGFVLNRINLAIVSMIPATGSSYFPSWMEIAISLGIVSAAALVFFFFVEHFGVYEHLPFREPRDNDFSPPIFDRSTEVWLGPQLVRKTGVHLLFFLIGASLSFALLPESALQGAVPPTTAVHQPRGLRPVIIDGNRADRAVLFNHDKHIREQGANESCVKCHHMLKPMDEATSCAECHRDMFLKTLIFDHAFHEKKHERNKGCEKCHKRNEPKSPQTVKVCTECHTAMVAKGSRITIQTKGPDRLKFAVGYKDAMHGLCVSCHKEKAGEYREKRLAGKPRLSAEGIPMTEAEWISKERLYFCPTCHRELHYTKDPIPTIILPPRESKEGPVPLFLEKMPSSAGGGP
ncbi:MAG: Ni/Fe-hydrogenase cytochrome b subunit [Proteobacteria bacterium]|nr:Ni/Fe-hydrogenase cytochrome b subunit [Pseudomonadota bacterium]